MDCPLLHSDLSGRSPPRSSPCAFWPVWGNEAGKSPNRKRARLGTWVLFPQNAQKTPPLAPSRGSCLSCPECMVSVNWEPMKLEPGRESAQLLETSPYTGGDRLSWGTSPWCQHGFCLLSLRRQHRAGRLVSQAGHLFSTPGCSSGHCFHCSRAAWEKKRKSAPPGAVAPGPWLAALCVTSQPAYTSLSYWFVF